jgi:hypothetical protein
VDARVTRGCHVNLNQCIFIAFPFFFFGGGGGCWGGVVVSGLGDILILGAFLYIFRRRLNCTMPLQRHPEVCP